MTADGALSAAGEAALQDATAGATEEAAALATVRRRLLPWLGLLFIVSYLDRVNISFAKLTMNAALGIDDAAYAFAAGIFFIGYFLFEVPSNLILQKVGARRWIARIMITWGVISGATAFVTGARGFVAMRLLLGIAEAGFFPGIILYLTYWFPQGERARVVGLFMIAVPLTGLIGSPLSGALLGLDGLLGLQGWQWVLLLEALPAVVLGVACLKLLPEGPEQASWLTPRQRSWLAATLAAEREAVRRIGHTSWGAALTHPRVWALAVAYFGVVLAVYGFSFWLPTLVHTYGVRLARVGWITALPFACGAPFMAWWGWRSDRLRERTRHLVISTLMGFAGFAAASVAGSLAMQVLCLCVAAMGVYGTLPVFWTLPTAFLTSAAAAAGIALINSVGNLGGYMGPQLVAWISGPSGRFGPALLALGVALLVPAGIVPFIARRQRT
jgi:MFS transporter, ACS family, tartrate transporter